MRERILDQLVFNYLINIFFSIQLFFANCTFCIILLQRGDSESKTVKLKCKVCGPNAGFTSLRNT